MPQNKKPKHPFVVFRPRLRQLRWLILIGLALLVIFYELGPAQWLYEQVGVVYHTLADIFIFGTIGPILAFVLLYFLERWLDERETTDLQAQILSQVREEAQDGRQLNDDTLQLLFAAAMLIESLKSYRSDIPSETAVQIDTMEAALHQAIQQLRIRLQSQEQLSSNYNRVAPFIRNDVC